MKRLAGFLTAPIRWIFSGVAGKTSWEWLELLIVPVLLAGGALYIDNQSEKRQEAIESARYENETTLANERAKQETLNSYLEQMKELLLSEGLRESPVDSEVRSVARAITTTTIKDLDAPRNALVIDFLRESHLIAVDKEASSSSNTKKLGPVLILSGLNLSSADLTLADLGGATLSGATLNEATLSDATLSDADLSGVNLRTADLSDAFLINAFLSGANLSEAFLINANLSYALLINADLSDADLSDANLSEADLRGAILIATNLSRAILSNANLSDANLSSARNITTEQLATAKLCKTQLPEDIDLDPDRDCEN